MIVFTALFARSLRRYPETLTRHRSSFLSHRRDRITLITIRGFYTTHLIMCQRFSGGLIIFFHHSLYIAAMRSEYFASMIRRFTFIVGVSSPSSMVSSEGSSRNFFTVS